MAIIISEAPFDVHTLFCHAVQFILFKVDHLQTFCLLVFVN